MEEKEVHETQPASPIPPDLEITPAFPTKMHPLPSRNPNKIITLFFALITLFICILTLYGAYVAFNEYYSDFQLDKNTYGYSSAYTKNTTTQYGDNWITYTNRKLGFQFSYPSELSNVHDQLTYKFEKSATGAGMLDLSNFSYSTKKNRELKTDDFYITISVLKVNPIRNTHLSKLVDNSIQNSRAWVGKEKIPDPKKFNIDNIEAYKGLTVLQGKDIVPAVWIISDNAFITITLQTPNSKNIGWFDQILSTFKFLNDDSIEENLDTTKWITYSGVDKEGHKFTFKYPRDWIYEEAKNSKEYNPSQKSSNEIYFGDVVTENHIGEKVPPYPAAGFVLNFSKDIKNQSLEDYAKGDSSIYKTTYTTVDGIRAIEIYYSGSVSGDSFTAILKKDNTVYSIGIPNSARIYLPYYKEIIKTFKFTQ